MRDSRSRQLDTLADIEALPDRASTGSDGQLLQTYTVATYPTTATAVYACHPGTATCDDTEGAAVTLTAGSAVTIWALNLGSAIPPSGTWLVASVVGGRTVFRFDG